MLVSARILLAVTLLTSSVVAMAWLAGWTRLHGLLDGMPTMKFNSAVCLALLSTAGLVSTSTGAVRRWKRAVCVALGGAVLAIGLLTLAQHQFALDFGIDTFFCADPVSIAKGDMAGRMSVATAVSLLLLAAGLLLHQTGLSFPGSILAVFAALLGMLGLCVTFVSKIAHLRWSLGFGTMAIHTAMLILLLALGNLLAWAGRRRMADDAQCLEVQAEIRRSWPTIKSVLATLAFSLAMTSFVAFDSQKQTHANMRADFEHVSQRLVREVGRRSNQIVYGLMGARGVYASSKSVERAEFAAYVASRDLPAEFPGAIGIGVIERVARGEVAEFIERERADGAPDLSIKVVSQPGGAVPVHPDLYVIKHVYPKDRNAQAWGLDVGSEPIRRAAAEEAVRTGKPTITGRIALVQDARTRAGFLYFVPIYKNGQPTETAEQRIAALDCLVYAPIILEDAMMDASALAGDGIDFDIFDGKKTTRSTQLYDNDDHLKTATGEIEESHYEHRLFHMRLSISVGGRSWTVITSTTPTFEAAIDHSATILTALSGTLLSFLLAVVVGSLGISRARAWSLAQDMTHELRSSEESLRVAVIKADRLAQIAKRTSNGVFVVNMNGQIEWINEGFTRMTGYELSEVAGRRPSEFLHGAETDPEAACQLDSAIRQGQSCRAELIEYAKDGRRYFSSVEIEPLRDEQQQITGFMVIESDVTQQREARALLTKEALTDKLTGLPNRALLNDRIQQAIVRAKRHEHYKFALLFLDFDRFKLINDTLGHEAGDMLLKEIAARLLKATRTGDSIGRADPDRHTSARLGGDEFVVLLDGIANLADATLVADRLLEVFDEPYHLGEHQVRSTASIGIVTSEMTALIAADLLRDADTAMYEAKQAGKGRYVVFDNSMRRRLQDRVDLEAALRVALEGNQFSLVYQPILSLESGRTECVEALLRWHHPDKGLLKPAEFLSVAEDAGLIVPIGQWVLREACAQFATWQKVMGAKAPAGISVNLSHRQLLQPGLPQLIESILSETGVEPRCLHLEIAERDLMRNAASAIEMMTRLSRISVKVDMDNFGAGDSSLACLHKFPIHTLKIDSSFVANLDRGRDFMALVRSVIQISHNMNIRVVAQGVERHDQVISLQSLECDLAQGNALSEPIAAHEMVELNVQLSDLPGMAA